MRIQQFITKVRMLLSFKAFTAVIFFLVAAVLFGLLFSNVKPVTYDIELFSIAEKTIRAPKTVIDMKKTEEERIKAAEEVERAYVYKQEVAQNRVSLISSLFDFVKEVNSGKNVNKTDKEKLTLLKKKLTGNADEKITESISDQVLFTLLELNSEELEEMKTQVVEQVGFTLQKRIREENLKDAKEEVKNAIIGSSLPEPLKDAASKIASFAIVPTETFDEALTNERQKVAMEQVEPVRILQGQVIVQEGYLIDRETYRQLELLGLMERTVSAQPAVGLAVFVLVVIALLYYYFYTLPLSEEKKQLYLILVSLVFIFSLILMKIIDLISDEEFSEIVYIFPSAMAGMLISVMLNERLAMIITFLLAACGGIIFNDGMSGTINSEMSMYILFSGFAGILFLSSQRRFNILQAGLVVSFINVLVILFLKLLGSGQYSEMEHFYYAMFAIASGLISAVLTIGLLPFFEAGFGILSTMKLIELSNPNHPLLKKILTETPGTYHHSIMVANLSEAACEAIGANGLLARVGCYYHDIGKTRRPQFFIENQMNIENPHNRLDPADSRDIIISHATDGANLLRKHKMPKEIIDIAEQHHGTTLVKYFYFQAKENNPEIEEKDFRYPGPKPQTKETAIISIADSVEAAVRSLSQPTPEHIQKLVHTIVQDRLQDGQFNECDITLKELEIVKRTLCETLNGIFHSRIEYPKDGDNK